MLNSDAQSESPVTAAEKKPVVLLLPETAGSFTDQEPLRKTLAGEATAIRVLLCLPEYAAHPLAATLAELKIETQILLGPDVEAPAASEAYALRAPPSTSPNDLTDFALALSDFVLVEPASEQDPLARTAKRLGKPVIVAGEALPPVTHLAGVTPRLDPELPGWRAWGWWFFGRLEQAIMEVLAFNWLGWKNGGVAESSKRLRRCAGLAWRPGTYFAPEDWKELAPDGSALDASSKIVACFDAMDRSALHGSYIHRDLIWVAHLGAALAVVAAVAGHILPELAVWAGVTEVVALVLVAFLVLGARHINLQDRWTACRLGAEQLRIARMSLPLLVLPPALATADAPPAGNGHGSKEIEFGFLAMAEVKRAVRAQGLPRLDDKFAPAQAAAWLHCIVADQIDYHRRNHRKLERAEGRLRLMTQSIFVISLLAVLAHFHFHEDWLLFLTAAGPALAAALHGAGTRLGIVHRAALSLEMERELSQVDASLAASMTVPPSADAWREVRRLAYEAATKMGGENTSWHGLVRRYRDELP